MTTYHLLLALHLVLAVFAVGPLVHAATTAGRGIRTGDGKATASASRLLRLYSYASVLVIASGIVLMFRDSPFRTAASNVVYHGRYLPRSGDLPLNDPSGNNIIDQLNGGSTPLAFSIHDTHRHIGSFSQTWIWLSIALWVIAVGIIHALIVPTLDKATTRIENEESVVTLTGRVAATGGLVGLLFAAIIVLMAFRPGQ